MTYRNRDGHKGWAMPYGPRLAVLRDRSLRLRPSGAIAIAEWPIMLAGAAFLGFALAVQL
jgi:hypothetical protein